MRFLLLILALSLAAPAARAELLDTPQPVMPGETPATSAPTDQPAPSPAEKARGAASVLAPDTAKKTAPKPQEPIQAADLSAQDQNDVARIQEYLNGLRSISADFLQVDDRGVFSRGSIDIQRPGKMRVVYAPPSKDFIVADGTFVHIWDGSLKSQTNVPESASLAEFILRDPIVLSGGVTITDFKRLPAKLELTLVETRDPGEGQLTLIFEDHPLLLRQWRVLDAEGRTTGVNLENEQMDVAFDRDTFDFVPPNFGKGGKAQ